VDAVDVRILELLQTDGRMSLADLSRRVHLSRPTVAERMRRLLEAGVIEGFTARVSPDAVGRSIHAVVLMSEIRVACAVFERAMATDTDVLTCHRITGQASYLLVVAVADVKALERLADRLVPLGRVNTSVVLSTPVAQGLVLPPREG